MRGRAAAPARCRRRDATLVASRAALLPDSWHVATWPVLARRIIEGFPMADDDDLVLSELADDELVPQMHDDLYDGMKDEVVEGVNILLDARLDALRRADQGAGRRDEGGRRRLPRRHPVRARGAAGGQRDEGRDGGAEAAAGRDRRAAHGQDGDRHGQGRHPRHRQEPRGDDDGGRRVRGGRSRHQQPGRGLSRRAGRTRTRTSSGCRRC